MMADVVAGDLALDRIGHSLIPHFFATGANDFDQDCQGAAEAKHSRPHNVAAAIAGGAY
jgi:hypothetical protein